MNSERSIASPSVPDFAMIGAIFTPSVAFAISTAAKAVEVNGYVPVLNAVAGVIDRVYPVM